MKPHYGRKSSVVCLTIALALAGVQPARAANAYFADLGGMLASLESGPLSLIIGACASLAVLVSHPNGSGVAIKNPINKYDDSGAVHNQIMDDYFRNYRKFSLNNYYKFLQGNYKKYGATSLPAESVFADVVALYGNPNLSAARRIDLVDKELKSEGISEDVGAALRKLPESGTLEEISARIIDIENTALNSKSLNSAQLKRLSMLFSVLRYSVAYTDAK